MKALFKVPFGVGMCSLVMAFVVIIMVSVMSLTLITSYKSKEITNQEIEEIKAYYAAKAEANLRLMKIEEIYDIYCTTSSGRKDILESALKEIDGITKLEVTEELSLSYEVPISKTQVIRVCLKATPNSIIDEPSGSGIKILSWQVESKVA